jgi:hypothetical protein
MKNDQVAIDGAAPGNTAASSSPAKSLAKSLVTKPRRAPCPEPGSSQANKLALVILDVLAGARLPSEAAQQAGISLPRYYHLEQRVLDAIVRACEPRPRGKVRSPQRQVEELKRQISRLEQQCARQQALVRAAQRTIGLAPAAKPAAQSKIGRGRTSTKPDGSKPKRKRRPTVRALKAAKMLRAAEAASPAGADEITTAPPVAECVTNVT